MRGFLGSVAILAIIAGAICYANGWLVFHNQSESTTIELKTEQIKNATERVVDKGQKYIEEKTQTQPAVEPEASPTPNAPQRNSSDYTVDESGGVIVPRSSTTFQTTEETEPESVQP